MGIVRAVVEAYLSYCKNVHCVTFIQGFNWRCVLKPVLGCFCSNTIEVHSDFHNRQQYKKSFQWVEGKDRKDVVEMCAKDERIQVVNELRGWLGNQLNKESIRRVKLLKRRFKCTATKTRPRRLQTISPSLWFSCIAHEIKSSSHKR